MIGFSKPSSLRHLSMCPCSDSQSLTSLSFLGGIPVFDNKAVIKMIFHIVARAILLCIYSYVTFKAVLCKQEILQTKKIHMVHMVFRSTLFHWESEEISQSYGCSVTLYLLHVLLFFVLTNFTQSYVDMTHCLIV